MNVPGLFDGKVYSRSNVNNMSLYTPNRLVEDQDNCNKMKRLLSHDKHKSDSEKEN